MTLYFLVFLFFSFLQLDSALNIQTISNKWFFRQLSWTSATEYQWRPAEVPGFVHLDLMKNNMIPDPYYRDNEPKVQWVENEDWEYKSSFDVSSKILRSTSIKLRFEGLDTHATVYLNQALILKANNFFRSWEIDVKDQILPKGNVLLIKFKSAVRYDNETRDAFFPTIVPSDNPNRTPFSRKPRYHYGWDWGPRLVTCGIHKSVFLIGYDKAKLRSFELETLEILSRNNSYQAKIRAKATIEMAGANKGILFKLLWWETPSKAVVIDQGFYEQVQGSGQMMLYEKNFTLEKIELWWSRGLGEAKLYDFEFLIYGNDKVVKEDDAISRRFGIRTVQLRQVEDKDKNGSSFAIRLNGHDVFIKGANYIPPDSFSTRVTTKMHDQLINDMIGGNFNGIRVWGGGYFESQYFYEKCDENGIMIVHDFMFACEMYPGGDPSYMNNYAEEFIENVRRIKSHPSIVLWIGNNEVNEAWHNWGFTSGLTPENIETVWRWYLSIFEELFPNLVSQYDSQRPYWPSSPLYGYGHPESLRFGDSHFWSVWAGQLPIELYRDHVGRFMTEYGMQGILDINSISLFTLPEDRNLNSSVIKNHEKHLKGFQNLNLYMNETHGILPTDFEDYIYVSQIMQAYAIELAVTNHRSMKPYCMGTLYWQLNDAWPALSWASVDHYGHWKALHFAARRFNQDLMLLGKLNNEQNVVEIRALSESRFEKIVDLEIYVYDMLGNQKDIVLMNGYLMKAFSNEVVQTFDVEESKRNQLFFIMRVVDGESVWENEFFLKSPKYLNLAVDGNIKLSFSAKEKGIYVESDFFVKNLYIYSEKKYLKLDKNYFDLLPNRKEFVKILNFEEISQNLKEIDLKTKSYNDIIKKYPKNL